MVAPRVGAWIEILKGNLAGALGNVAPRVGAWIEIYLGMMIKNDIDASLPVRERGLKCGNMYCHKTRLIVAPRVGAWIEIIWSQAQ